MAEAVYDEQQRILLASGVSISDNELKLFHPVQMQHLEELMDIAEGVMDNLEHRLLTDIFSQHPGTRNSALEWSERQGGESGGHLGVAVRRWGGLEIIQRRQEHHVGTGSEVKQAQGTREDTE
ncbi:hypothetical protein PISMIDRAFT_25544 [Pisolithus microcarpus 441]|uniref:Uncharacterized protein n=1 Tax=Pisolithus microcarpus 441 TaxID=765257 RepID=A0A0C9Y982_9AGAM|nr:hypothetical protein PISMIDRAFT_25544 [Pisolithus microcarpus 441]